MDQPVSGYMTRLPLEALQEISGAQYVRILEAAGMTRFLTELPPLTPDPVSNFQEWDHLFHNTYLMLGEDLFRLFGRNLGTRLGQRVIQLPWAAATAARLHSLPPAERLAAVIAANTTWAAEQGIIYLCDVQPASMTVTPQPCHYCVGCTGAQKPICSVYPSALSLIFSYLYGQRVRVEERECRAMGASACVMLVVGP